MSESVKQKYIDHRRSEARKSRKKWKTSGDTKTGGNNFGSDKKKTAGGGNFGNGQQQVDNLVSGIGSFLKTEVVFAIVGVVILVLIIRRFA